MIKLAVLCLAFSIQSVTAEAETSFTALAVGAGNAVYVGVKDVKKSVELVSHLYQLDAKGLKATAIRLPKDLQEREIVVLLPSQQQLFVVTQWTIEQGDNALLEVYDLRKKTWNKVRATENCTAFDAVTVRDKALVFHCDKNNGESWQDIVLPLGAHKIVPRPEIKLPQNTASLGDATFSLAGSPNAPEQLKMVKGGKVSTVLAPELLKKSH